MRHANSGTWLNGASAPLIPAGRRRFQRVLPVLKFGFLVMKDAMARPLAEVDPDIYRLILKEAERQHSQLELIASENFTSEAVLEASGSVFTNKYAEGYPGRRYYGGCEFADAVENLARDRAKQLFRAEYVNVQPHSGSQANEAAY